MNQQSILKKIRKIESLISEVKQEIKKENSIPIIKAGIGNKKIIAELSIPGQPSRPVIYEITEDYNLNMENLCRAIHAAISQIPITLVIETSFKLYIAQMDDWNGEIDIKEQYSARISNLINKMLEIFNSYSVKPELLYMDELKEIEEEYDTLYNSGKFKSS